MKETVAFLRARGTVIDPTQSWNELLGHAAGSPVASFQPGIAKIPRRIKRIFSNAGAAGIDAATARARLERGLRIVKALHDAGVPVVAGTDEGVPGYSVYREIELYVEAGLRPLEALQAATIVPARAMKLDAELGTIERGKRADLAILNRSPLDDIHNIRSVAMDRPRRTGVTTRRRCGNRSGSNRRRRPSAFHDFGLEHPSSRFWSGPQRAITIAPATAMHPAIALASGTPASCRWPMKAGVKLPSAAPAWYAKPAPIARAAVGYLPSNSSAPFPMSRPRRIRPGPAQIGSSAGVPVAEQRHRRDADRHRHRRRPAAAERSSESRPAGIAPLTPPKFSSGTYTSGGISAALRKTGYHAVIE